MRPGRTSREESKRWARSGGPGYEAGVSASKSEYTTIYCSITSGFLPAEERLLAKVSAAPILLLNMSTLYLFPFPNDKIVKQLSRHEPVSLVWLLVIDGCPDVHTQGRTDTRAQSSVMNNADSLRSRRCMCFYTWSSSSGSCILLEYSIIVQPERCSQATKVCSSMTSG